MRCRGALTLDATALCRMVVALWFPTLWRCPASGTLLLLFPRLLGCCMTWTPLCWTFSGQVRRIWFDVVIHHREDGGFQLVSFPSLAKSIPSLHSGSSVCVFLLVSLLTLWCLQPFWRRSRVCFSHPYPRLAGFCRLSMLPCSILRTSWKNVREGSGHPVSPVEQAIVFWEGGLSSRWMLACCRGTSLLAGMHLVYPG